MLHNHIHNNGILAKEYAWVDRVWPYMLEPLLGHSWNSYNRITTIENNGPRDCSSTLCYQRNDLLHFLFYVGRFMAFIWLEWPLYFLRKNTPSLAIRTAILEFSSYALIHLLAKYNLRAAIFVLVIPLLQLRVAMMVGNWSQHVLVDELDPDSDFRSSITLIDVAVSNFLFKVCTPKRGPKALCCILDAFSYAPCRSAVLHSSAEHLFYALSRILKMCHPMCFNR